MEMPTGRSMFKACTLMALLLSALGLSAWGAEDSSAEAALAEPALFAYDRAGRLRPAVTRRRGTDRVRVDELRFTSFDGERVPALLAIPRGRSGPMPCVIVQGGIGFTKDEARDFWPFFAGLGAATFSIDARFHGERATSGVTVAKAANEPSLLVRMLRESVIDLRRAIDYLQTRRECDSRRIGYMGLSFGSFLGSLLAGADERVQAPVLVVSGADWRAFFSSSDALLPGLRLRPRAFERALKVLAPLDPERWVGRIHPRPVLILNARRDEAIPRASAEALHRAARPPKRIVWYQGDHVTFDGDEAARVFSIIQGWFRQRLVGR